MRKIFSLCLCNCPFDTNYYRWEHVKLSNDPLTYAEHCHFHCGLFRRFNKMLQITHFFVLPRPFFLFCEKQIYGTVPGKKVNMQQQTISNEIASSHHRECPNSAPVDCVRDFCLMNSHVNGAPSPPPICLFFGSWAIGR